MSAYMNLRAHGVPSQLIDRCAQIPTVGSLEMPTHVSLMLRVKVKSVHVWMPRVGEYTLPCYLRQLQILDYPMSVGPTASRERPKLGRSIN